MNKLASTQKLMVELGLSSDEARILFELFRAPSTHLALSQATDINRTKVYRIVQDLERKSLVAKRTDDRGTFLVACDPSALEIAILEQEERVMSRRAALQQLLPTLQAIQSHGNNAFVVQTYEGVDGLKQMCWHELKAQNELLVLGAGTIEEMIPSRYWAEKHRSANVSARYRVREIMNGGNNDKLPFTSNQHFMDLYEFRLLPPDILNMESQTTIYNDTVAVYHWRDNQKSGVEIINKAYADMMRQIFEAYWSQATVPADTSPNPGGVHDKA